MSKHTIDHRLESRGTYTLERIGRPDTVYDQRSKYACDVHSFDQTLRDRKRIGFGSSEEKIEPAREALSEIIDATD